MFKNRTNIYYNEENEGSVIKEVLDGLMIKTKPIPEGLYGMRGFKCRTSKKQRQIMTNFGLNPGRIFVY